MKKLVWIFFLILTFAGYSQEKNFNRFSFETAYGLSQPLSPNDNSGYDAGAFSGMRHFEMGLRYMINQDYGFKLGYAYDKFQHEYLTNLSVKYHKISGEMVFNLSHILDFHFNRKRNFQIQSHAGIGVTFARPSSIKNSEHIGNLIVGITPQVKLSNRIGLITDLSYNFIFKQHFDYSGTLINPDYDSVTGSFLNLSVGLQFYLGQNDFHADWY